LFGVMCYTEAAAVASANAYAEGGIDLQNEVVDNMVNVTMACIRVAFEDALEGYFVYEGATIGAKTVVGVAPTPHGPAIMFGLMTTPGELLEPKDDA